MKFLKIKQIPQNNIGLRCLNTVLKYTKILKHTKGELKIQKNKHILLFAIFLCGDYLQAFDYSELNATIISSDIIKTDKNIKIEQLILSKDNTKYPIYIINDRYITTNVIDMDNKVDFNVKFAEKTAWNSIYPIIKTIPNDYIISFKNNDKELQYIFLDPLCPYCQDFIQALTLENLKELNLNIILTPLYGHGDLAMIKSALIVASNKNAKNDKEKLEILKKYFTSKNESEIANTDIYNKIDEYRNEFFVKKLITQTPSFLIKPEE